MSAFPAFAFRTSTTPFVAQGAFSGGGYNKTVSISTTPAADGPTIVVNYDGSNGWMWNYSTSTWENCLAQDRVPGSAFNAANRDWGRVGAGGAGNANAPGTYALQVAPSDPNRIYAIAWGAPQYNSPGQIWKSTNRGVSFVDTGFRLDCYLVTSLFGSHGWGPTLAIDPINPDRVFVGGLAGAIWQTTDGFISTFTCLSLATGPLNGSLPSATVTGVSTSGGIPTFTFSSTPTVVQNKNAPANGTSSFNFSIAYWNITSTSGFVPLTGDNRISSSTATTLTGSGPMFQTTNIGDTLIFGWGPCICFDPSSSTVGGYTHGIYVSWGYGASAIWHSTDAGASFAATTGGPDKVAAIACTPSGVLYAIKNFTDTNAAWIYSSGTWTNITGITSSSSNALVSVACDPTNFSRALYGYSSGDIIVTTDGGATWFQPASKLPRVATDVPWMSRLGTLEDSMTLGQIVFDPITSGKLWMAEGIGIWTATCPVNASSSIQWTSQTINCPTIIVDQIIKPPGGKAVTAVQDRSGFIISDPTQEAQPSDMMRAPWLTMVSGYVDNGAGPGYNGTTGNVLTITSIIYSGQNIINTSCFSDSNMANRVATVSSSLGGGKYGLSSSASISPQTFYLSFNAPINHGQSVDYAKSNPSFLILIVGSHPYTSTDGGVTWFPTAALPGGSQYGGAVACQTPSNFVWFPYGGLAPCYTLDGGATWANCLFAGSSITGGWMIQWYDNRKVVCADEVNSTTYYAYNWGSTTHGVWKSTDGGANWTQIVSTAVLGTNSTDFQLKAVKGYAGHLMCSPGTAWQGAGPQWSVDGGVTWYPISNIQTAWQMVPGKAESVSAYPSVYLAGILKASADPTQTPGIFRSDDFDPNNPGTMTPTWTRYCNAPGLNMDVAKSMCGDWDTYGSFWGGFGGTGYFYGKLI